MVQEWSEQNAQEEKEKEETTKASFEEKESKEEDLEEKDSSEQAEEVRNVFETGGIHWLYHFCVVVYMFSLHWFKQKNLNLKIL